MFDDIEHMLDMRVASPSLDRFSKMSHPPYFLKKQGHVSQGRESSLKTLYVPLGHKGYIHLPTSMVKS